MPNGLIIGSKLDSNVCQIKTKNIIEIISHKKLSPESRNQGIKNGWFFGGIEAKNNFRDFLTFRSAVLQSARA